MFEFMTEILAFADTDRAGRVVANEFFGTEEAAREWGQAEIDRHPIEAKAIVSHIGYGREFLCCLSNGRVRSNPN